MERGGTDPSVSAPEATHIDTFLLQHIVENPGLRFGAIVRAAWTTGRFPRTTAARHLARLVRFGEVTLRADRTYVAGEPSAAILRTALEVRWYGRVVLIRPNGTSQELLQEEFRIVAGRIDHLEFDWSHLPHQVNWWSTASSHVAAVPAARSATRQPTSDVRFAKPLSARETTWQRYQLYANSPERYRMSHTRRATARGSGVRGAPIVECDWIDVPHQTRRFSYRLAPDAHLRLMVVLPEGYPVGAVRSRVRYVSDLDRFDTAEEARLAKLGDGENHQEGMRRSGSTLTLSVPRPRLDRRYEIEWVIPHTARWNRWRDAGRRRDAR